MLRRRRESSLRRLQHCRLGGAGCLGAEIVWRGTFARSVLLVKSSRALVSAVSLSMLVVAVSVLAIVKPPSAHSSGSGSIAVGVDTPIVWSDPADAAEGPHTVTFSFRITANDSYVIWVVNKGTIWAEYDLGYMVASDEVQRVTWDGRDGQGDIAARGDYKFQILRSAGRDTYSMYTSATSFQVYRRSQEVFASDRRRERDSGDVDVDFVTLTNAADGVGLRPRHAPIPSGWSEVRKPQPCCS